jgi:hypothetical protein
VGGINITSCAILMYLDVYTAQERQKFRGVDDHGLDTCSPLCRYILVIDIDNF